MKYCSYCGKEVNTEAVVCIHCGCAIKKADSQPSQNYCKDKADTALIVLCVLFPIIGLILWAVNHQDSPKAAAAYGKASLIAISVELGLAILIYAAVAAFIAALI